MAFELWVTFVAATLALLAVPGPTVAVVVSYALGQGRDSAWATVPGVMLGDFTSMTVSLLGAGAVLATSASLFTAMKLVGAVYLVYMGIRLLRSKPRLDDAKGVGGKQSRARMFLNTYIVTTFNPKGIVFFIAFVPQFIDPSEPAFRQFAILEATFVFLAGVNVAMWATLAGTLRARFQHPQTLRHVNRVGASFLIGAGLLTAVVWRSS
jgi:threonine/homoserine/homoserine lactone efflux protein